MQVIREAIEADLVPMLDLAEARREQYAFYHPLFHRPAHGARDLQGPFFSKLMANEDFDVLVSETAGRVDGFLIGHVVPAPPVYDPGGLTCVIDDFVVAGADTWARGGRALLEEMKARARARGAVQVIVVTAPQDNPKRDMLEDAGLSVVSEWLAGNT